VCSSDLVDGKFTRFVKGKIRQCTISQTRSGKYYISILTEQTPEKKCENGKTLGINMAFHGLAVLSTGQKVNAPRWYYDSQTRLVHAYRMFARTVEGSKGHEEAWLYLARVSEHIVNQRLDFLHKLSRTLADTFENIKVEDIDMQALAQHKNWGKKVNDLGFGMLRQMLAYKATNFEVIDKWFASSQFCSQCGYKNSEVKDLSVREWTCPECGAHHDRDVNAAINIRNYDSTAATAGTDGGNAVNARGLKSPVDSSNETIGQLVEQSLGSEKSCGHHRKLMSEATYRAGVSHNPLPLGKGS
jgi:putative transposase